MKHSDIALGFVHTPFNWVYPDAATRTAAGGFDPAFDVHKLALQLDTGDVWRVSAIDGLGNPTWAPLTTAGASVAAETTRAETAEALLAPIASPTLTGTPRAPTPAVDDSSTKIATTAAIQQQGAAAAPAMDGAAAVGASPKWARADHVHPSDTSRDVAGAATAAGAAAVTAALATAGAGALAGDATRNASTIATPVLRDFVSLKDAPFGCKFDGATNDAAGQRAAVAFVAVNGGTVWAPAGTSVLNSTDGNGDCVPVPVNSPGVRYQGAGWDVTKIQQGASCTRFLEPKAGFAAGDHFQNVWVMDLTIDRQGQAANDYVVIGTIKAGVVTGDINIDHIFVLRVRTMNVPSTNTARNVCLAVSTASGGTQRNITDIWVEKFEFNGGRVGVICNGGNGGGGNAINVYHDRIYIRDGFHDVGATPTGFFTSANAQLVSSGWGGYHMLVENVYGKNSFDVAWEIDGANYCMVRRCTAVDCWTNHFYHTNFNTGTNVNVTSQCIVFERCVAIAAAIVNAVGAFAAIMKNAVPLGEVVLRGCEYVKSCSTSSGSGVTNGIRANSSGYGYALQIGQSATLTPMYAVTIEGLTITDVNSTWTAGNQWTAYVNLNLSTTPAVPTRVTMRVSYNINTTNTGTSYSKWLFVISGTAYLDPSSQLNINYTGTGDAAGALRVGYIGGITTGGDPTASTSTINGRIRVNIQSITGDTAPTGMKIAGTGTLAIPTHSLLYVDFDAANWVGTNARVTLVATAQTAVSFTGIPQGLPSSQAAGPYQMSAVEGPVCVTATLTVNLPPTSGGAGGAIRGLRYTVKNFAAGITVTVSTGGANKIDTGGAVNATSHTIVTQGQSNDYMVAPNGSDWILV